jgi:hypothetical protein
MILDTYNTPNKISQSLIDSVVAHADIHLDLSDLEELQIHFKAANGDNCGYFDGIGDEEDGVAAIEINSKKSVEEIIKTIFHELVHVQQVLHEKFCDIEKTWFGETYEGIDYENLPWEIDAFEKEEILWNSFQNIENNPLQSLKSVID